MEVVGLRSVLLILWIKQNYFFYSIYTYVNKILIFKTLIPNSLWTNNPLIDAGIDAKIKIIFQMIEGIALSGVWSFFDFDKASGIRANKTPPNTTS